MIHYKKRIRYKFTLVEDYAIDTGIVPREAVNTPFLQLDSSGRLSIRRCYSWDGATGALNTRNIIRASLVHDALYQLMREGYLAPDHRLAADRLMHRICVAAGMNGPYAWIVYICVRLFGASSVQADTRRAP